MKLNVVVDERTVQVDVPEEVLQEAEEFFQKMDRDMDRGWQMGMEFIERPNAVQRCQIAADRLLGSLSNANQTMIMLMAGYILKRLPGVTGVNIDINGEMLHTDMIYAAGPGTVDRDTPRATDRDLRVRKKSGGLTKMEAMTQAGKEVSKVYKSGKGYRYATLDYESGRWVESPILDSEKDASEQRMQTFKSRFDKLYGSSG